MPIPLLGIEPELVPGPHEWLGQHWGDEDLQRPQADGDAVDVAMSHFDGTYVYERRAFNRYRQRHEPALDREIAGAHKTRSWEEQIGSQCVTVTETYQDVQVQRATVFSRYVEVWLYDAKVKEHYDRYTSTAGLVALAIGDTSAAAVAYGATVLKPVAANPTTTILGATFATAFMVGTAAYGALTDWGGKLYTKDWEDYGYRLGPAGERHERRVSLYRSSPHPCAKTEQQLIDDEHRKAEREHYEAEQQKKLEEARKKGVEWEGGTTGGEHSNDEVGSSDVDGKKSAPWVWIGAGLLAILLVVVLALAFTGGGDGSDDEVAQRARDDSAVASPDSSARAGSAPSQPAQPASGPLVSGDYDGTVEVVGGKDPAGHACCVKPTTRWGVLQTRDTSTGAITIALSDVVDGVDLSAPLSTTGASFSAVGTGTVAGFAGTQVQFDGSVTPQEGLHGTLVVGGNGTLPTGQSITFQVDMRKV